MDICCFWFRKSVTRQIKAAVCQLFPVRRQDCDMLQTQGGHTDVSGFVGTNASFYQEKAAVLMEQIQGSVNKIRSGAEEVRRTANRIHKAELLARTLAEARNY